MPGDIVGVEWWTRKSADRAGCIGELPFASKRRIVKIRPEHRLRRPERLWTDRGLPPTHHLRVEPCGLHGIGPRRALSPHQQIATAFPDGSIRRNLETAVE